jgi:hypothetical protein
MTNLRAKEAERAAEMFLKRKQAPGEAMDNDMFFDAKEFSTSSSSVDHILKSVS